MGFRCLVRDQEVDGSNPFAPTILSLAFSIAYAACAASFFSAVFGTFGTTERKSNPNPHRSAHFLRNATSSLILSQRSFNTRDKTGVIRRQKQSHLINFLGFPHASHGDGGHNPRNHVGRLPTRQRRIDRARTNNV